jgi:hypothetical protein
MGKQLLWSQIREAMLQGESLAWKPIPGEVQKRALFLGSQRLHNDCSLRVCLAEQQGDIRVEVGQVVNGFVDSFVCSLRSTKHKN